MHLKRSKILLKTSRMNPKSSKKIQQRDQGIHPKIHRYHNQKEENFTAQDVEKGTISTQTVKVWMDNRVLQRTHVKDADKGQSTFLKQSLEVQAHPEYQTMK